MNAMNDKHWLHIFLLAVTLSGCTGALNKISAQRPQPPEDALFYNVLAAEIAGHSGNLQQAVQHYKKVLEITEDTKIIQRAARIMLYAEDYPAVAQALERWLQLDPQDAEVRQMAATNSLQQGDLASATASLEWLINSVGDKKKGFQLLATLLRRLSDKQIALDAMAKMAARYPHILEAHIHHARFAFTAKQYQQSIAAATRAVQLDNDHVDANTILARAQIELGDTDNALQTLSNLLEQSPDNSRLRPGYARLLVAVNRYESALKQFEILLKTQPHDAELIYSAALTAMRIRSYDTAEKYLNQLLTLGKRQQEAWFHLGRLAENRKRFEQAQSWYAKIDQEGLYIDAQMGAARIQAKTGQLQAAKKRYANLRASYPEHAITIWLSESETLREIYDDQGAFELLNDALKLHSDNVDLRYSRALAAERINRLDILESDLKHVLQTDPDHAHALNALGYTLADRTDRLEEALSYIQKAIKLQPNDPAIIDSMGWVHYRLGDLDKALEYLTKANKALRDGEVAAHLGEVLWMRGEREAAMNVWEEALRQYPENKILIRAIERFTP